MEVRSVLASLAATVAPRGPAAPAAGDAFVPGDSSAAAPRRADLASLFTPKETLADCEIWRADLPERVYSSPAVGPQGELYAVSQGTGVTCLNADGSFRWRAGIADVGHQATPLVMDSGDVVVVTGAGLACLGKGGEERWSAPVGTSQGGAAKGPDGSLYYLNDQGRLFRLDGRDGSELWKADMPPGPWNMNPAHVSSDEAGNVYSVLHPGRMEMRDRDGRLVGGSGSEGCRVFSGVTADRQGNAVYITQDCDLRCNTPEGSPKWTAWFSSGPAIPALLELTTKPVLSPDEKTVYAGGQNGELHAVDMATGERRWDRDMGLQMDGDHLQVGPDGTLYVGGENPASVSALSPEDGHTLWTFRAKDPEARVGIALSGGTVYLTTSDGKAHALDQDALAKRATRKPPVEGKALEIRLEAGTLTIGGVSLPVR